MSDKAHRDIVNKNSTITNNKHMKIKIKMHMMMTDKPSKAGKQK